MTKLVERMCYGLAVGLGMTTQRESVRVMGLSVSRLCWWLHESTHVLKFIELYTFLRTQFCGIYLKHFLQLSGIKLQFIFS